ncbi:MAG: hypothetical protein IRZ19_04620 [Pyrinomonas methylaliphatogenes]|jgi:hypothetical protein|nr:hypothetical protein [Pyrinomonas methylaliphatogenes]
MFRVGASFSGHLETRAELAHARAFFDEPRTFIDLMPNVQEIVVNADGTRRWLIQAEVPWLGRMSMGFKVRRVEDEECLIEWVPVIGEQRNLLRYALAFERKGGRTSVRIVQQIELRRARASELHRLAGVLGADRISAEMQSRLREIMETFLRRARERLDRADVALHGP